MGLNAITYALSRNYTNMVALGIGSMRVEGTTVYFTIAQTGEEVSVTLPTPKDGASITNVDIDEDNYLVCTLSDGVIIKSTNPIELVGGTSGEDNKIESISVNGTEVTPDENKNVDIDIPNAPVQSISQNGTTLEIDENGNVDIPIADTNKIEVIKQNGTELEIDENKSVNINADVNTIEVVKVNGATLNIDETDKSVDIQVHTHDNKDVLDNITEEKITWWDKAEENVQSDYEQIDETADDFIKNKPTFEVLTEEDVIALVGLSTEELEGLATILNDTEVRIDKTYSSSKIYTELNRILEEGKTYTLEEIAKATGASYKIATSIADMTSTKYIYLLANGDTYDMYICEEENSTPVKIGTTSVTLTDYYNKTECDNRYVLATAFALLNNSVGDVSNLQTTSKVIVDAVNEILTSLNTTITTVTEHTNAIGDITTLKTSAKDNLVNAVNEVKNSVDGIVVDTVLSSDSNNAIANATVAKKFTEVDGKIIEIDDESVSENTTWSSSKIESEISKLIPYLTIDATSALQVKRNSVTPAFINFMDVYGNLYTLQCGDQVNRFYVLRSAVSGNYDITVFSRTTDVCYLYPQTYMMTVLQVIGDLSVTQISKSSIPSTVEVVNVS